MISSLSIPMSGRKIGSVATLPIDRQVLERLRRHLSDDVAGHERLRAPRARDALGDAQHEPAVDDDPHRAGHREHDLLLDVAERARDTAATAAATSSAACTSSRALSCDARDRIG